MLAYAAFVVYTEASDGVNLWYIPLLLASLLETMPIKQLYMLRLFDDIGGADDDMCMRNDMKASLTFTGIGSISSFLTSSQTYTAFDIKGVAYLFLGMISFKFAIILLINYLHARKMKNMSKSNHQSIRNFGALMRELQESVVNYNKSGLLALR